MTPQDEQGYRIKTAQKVCGNCRYTIYNGTEGDNCKLGGFGPVDKINGTCKKHDWRVCADQI